MDAPGRRRGSWPGRLDAALGQLEATFIGAALALASLVLFVNVTLRYVFLAPLSWAEELSVYLVVWIVFVGGSVAVRSRGHIAIDLLPRALSPPNRARLAVLVCLLMLVFFAVFFWYSGQHTLRVWASGQRTPVMLAPMWLTYLAMPVGSALMFLRTTQLLRGILAEGPSRDGAAVELRD